MAELLTGAGLPPGVLSDLPGPGPGLGDALVRHPAVRLISATASTRTGQAIMRGAADGMKRVSLELGGHTPFVVLDDGDVEEAAAAAARRSFSNMGQICIAVNRVLVDAACHDGFVDALAASGRRCASATGWTRASSTGRCSTRRSATAPPRTSPTPAGGAGGWWSAASG